VWADINWRTVLYGASAIAALIGMFTLNLFRSIGLDIFLIVMLIMADKRQ